MEDGDVATRILDVLLGTYIVTLRLPLGLLRYCFFLDAPASVKELFPYLFFSNGNQIPPPLPRAIPR